MGLDPLFQRLYDTPVAVAIRENGTLFPWIESVHVLAITLVVGSIFAVAAVTGGLLFSSNAVKYSHNTFFLSKMALLVLAGINMLAFNFLTSRSIDRWDDAHHHHLPLSVKAAGFFSMALWLAIIVCGRWIGFTMSAF